LQWYDSDTVTVAVAEAEPPGPVQLTE